jgi:hypothetical protein
MNDDMPSVWREPHFLIGLALLALTFVMVVRLIAKF